MFSSTKSNRQTADFVGIISAIVCLVHCLAGPIILGTSAHLHEHSHFFLDPDWNYFFLGLGFVAVLFSSRYTKSRFLRFSLWTTYAALALAVIFETYADYLHYVVYAASVGLIIAHVFNLRKHFS